MGFVDDLYNTNGPEASSPALRFAAVTPSNTVNFSRVARGLYVGGSGDVAVVGVDNVAVTFVGVTAGQFLPLRCIRVNSTGTTATNIVWMD